MRYRLGTALFVLGKDNNYYLYCRKDKQYGISLTKQELEQFGAVHIESETQEIEELSYYEGINLESMVRKINELCRAINHLRKEK